jgi:KamA family protein
MIQQPRKVHFYGIRDIDTLPPLQKLPAHERHAMKVVASVLPFRTNNYILDELVQWEQIPDDPMFQLTFPQQGMLNPEQFVQVERLLKRGDSSQTMAALVHQIRLQLNPHPSGQLCANVPLLEGHPVAGLQHKYTETCLVFPSHGQTSHAYCTYCFRWPQFIGQTDLKFATDEHRQYLAYLRQHQEVTDVLFTGGDPMVMRANLLASYIEPLLAPEFEHIRSIRIGTKSVASWPYRYITDSDADDLLRLFERVVQAGKHLAIMAHYNHWIEISTEAARTAIGRIRSTGAVIRTQSPIIKHVNDSPEIWKRLWEEAVHLGCIPYYLFIARETGANGYFAVPLSRASAIFHQAYQEVSGLARTVRGPTMSTYHGKVMIAGIMPIGQEKVFVLTFLQARNPDWCGHPFLAQFDESATWIDQLRPVGINDFFKVEPSIFTSETLAEHPALGA